MGILRYFLAVIVVFCHVPETKYGKPLSGNGGLAVQAFFVISGFYMALIFEKYNLNEKTYLNLKNFYFSRMIRIYPIYYLCLAITLLLYKYDILPPFAHLPSDVFCALKNLPSKLMYLIQNLFIFGQSLMRFFIYDANLKSFNFYPMNDGYPDNFLGSSYAIVGQSWSLSLELTFYLLVPFLLGLRKTTLFFICLASFGLRLMLAVSGYYSSNIQHAFFPIELGVFLLGVLTYYWLYIPIHQQVRKNHQIGAWIAISAIGFYSFIIYPVIPNSWINFKYWLFVLIVTIAVPYLFCYFKDSKLDRLIGELSYPVYMTHFIFIALMLHRVELQNTGYVVLLASTFCSYFIAQGVAKPLDLFRHARFLRHKGAEDQRHYINSSDSTIILRAQD